MYKHFGIKNKNSAHLFGLLNRYSQLTKPFMLIRINLGFCMIISMVIMMLSGQDSQYFLADHPFIILMRTGGDNGTILFYGKISNPVCADKTKAPPGEPIKDPYAQDIYISLE